MSTTAPLVVVGGGVAGCAAAVAAAMAGATVILLEAGSRLGGVAVQGEHRTLCGLAPLDGAHAELLEPAYTAPWLPALATGPAYRQGRVWLWPTSASTLEQGLRRRLDTVAVEPCCGRRVVAAALAPGGLALGLDDGRTLHAAATIDASGAGVVARLLGLPWVAPRQWPAHRATMHLPGLAGGTAARVAALRRAQEVVGGAAAMALVPIDLLAGTWQWSLDVAPSSAAGDAAATAQRVASHLGGTLLAAAPEIAERDHGRPQAALTLAELFAERARGLCWAAWPREEHGADGVTWVWPPADRHGVPARAARPIGAPPSLWCIGKGAAVEAEAAAALRVTGTCLAMGAAVGALAAGEMLTAPADRAR